MCAGHQSDWAVEVGCWWASLPRQCSGLLDSHSRCLAKGGSARCDLRRNRLLCCTEPSRDGFSAALVRVTRRSGSMTSHGRLRAGPCTWQAQARSEIAGDGSGVESFVRSGRIRLCPAPGPVRTNLSAKHAAAQISRPQKLPGKGASGGQRRQAAPGKAARAVVSQLPAPESGERLGCARGTASANTTQPTASYRIRPRRERCFSELLTIRDSRTLQADGWQTHCGG